MLATLTGLHVTELSVANILGLVAFLIVWIGLVECTKIVVVAVRNDPLIGWAIGPLGISTLFLCEPSPFFILLSVMLPALVSGAILYLGLFTNLPSPLSLPHYPLVIVAVIVGGVLVTNTRDVINALRDLRYPLWGEARVLCTLQRLRASCASIHFTPFGLSYLREHFGSSPTELLQAF
jgi:hypothetical protein